MTGPATFKEALAAAEKTAGRPTWIAMSPPEQTQAIYREMRRIDRDRAAALKEPISVVPHRPTPTP
jgi:hypothetical protein